MSYFENLRELPIGRRHLIVFEDLLFFLSLLHAYFF